MYRNTYLELYKTASSKDSSLTLLLGHFTQIYNTLGCVLQDLEFQIGKALAQSADESSHRSVVGKERAEQCLKLKEEDGGGRSMKRELDRQSGQSRQRVAQLPKKVNISLESQSNWMSKLIEGKPSNQFQSRAIQMPRNAKGGGNLSSNSFEDLFSKKSSRMELENSSSNPLGAIPQVAEENSHFVVQNNTFDDFFDRFFNENGSSRKSR